MDPEQIKLIQEWVKLDNTIILKKNESSSKEIYDKLSEAKEKVKELDESINDIVEKKKKIESDIMTYVLAKKLENIKLNISDGIITFSKKTVQKPLSQKFLKDILQKYAEEHPEENIKDTKIFEYILANVEKKVSCEMNRTLKDK
jgi:hypothetical protein